MRLLTIDVGAGTQDILLYDSNIEIANAIKMILPSEPKLLASKVQLLTQQKKDIVVYGETMGGYPFSSALKKHIAAGFKVKMTPTAARSIRDDLDIVKAMNIDIISESELFNFEKEGYVKLKVGDLNLNSLENVFSLYGMSLKSVDGIAAAVQDHGDAPKGQSERKFRFENLIKPGIESGGSIEEFAFKTGEVPPEFTRMKAMERIITREGFKGIVMDTGPAVLFGALEDDYLKSNKDVIGVLNFGNQHTLGGVIKKSKLVAVFEHHTVLMNGEKAKNHLLALADGNLSSEEVFEDNGHGAFTLETVGSKNLEALVVLGPQKNKMNFSIADNIYHAVPFGDQMMAGPAGLILASRKLLQS
ncbi:MAG: DUF1786 family protein [Promethearchaeota archaeon]